MSADIFKAEIAAAVKTLEDATGDLTDEAVLLQRTIGYNREDVYGMHMRIAAILSMAERLRHIGAKLDALHDLQYKIPAGVVDPGQGPAVEEPCPPTTPPPQPPSTRR